jgi:hypothetical protein
MGAGIVMGMAHDFSLAPAHAHRNLVGYVSLFLAGVYYEQHPGAARRTLATVHAWVAVVSAIAFPVGLGLVLQFGESYQPFVIIGSFVAFLGMLIFAFVVG